VAPPPGCILTVNAGSSSLKLRVLDEEDRVVGSRDSDATGDEAGLRGELEAILDEAPSIDAAGHRVVHGGPEFTGPTIVNPAVEDDLDGLADLAPLHNPPAVTAMRALDALRPELPTVACFDTAFHATMPAAASTYAVPAAWSERWPLRRYGFHGLSHSYASQRTAELLGRPLAELRIVTAHLGAGSSLCAVKGGRSVDTTMGFTPLEGLVMATRSGSVDPGLLLWVQRHGEINADEMERALDRESGLLALSGRSGDMREIVAGIEEGDERCRLAFDTYIHRLASGIAAMAAAMGGIDALVFTGGVGENSAQVRAATCASTGFLGVEIDEQANLSDSTDRAISLAKSAVALLVLSAREDIELAAQVRGCLSAGSRPPNDTHGRSRKGG
jgi:acetate kinase